jgi:membrane protease YdiL (CAAX protease family)
MSYAYGFTHPGPPPDPPELPEGVSPSPRWPWWYGPAAFFGAFLAGELILGIVIVAAGADPGDLPPEMLLIATLIQDTLLVAAALWLAAQTTPPKPWHFGLRPTRLWPAVGWAALGLISYVAFAIAYGAVVGPPEEQSIVEDLGVNESDVALITAGFLFVFVAPVVEEFFFRGFLYRALRTRLGIPAAATLAGLAFGLVHVFTGAEAVPVLAFLGVVFCLVYERTGSLYPVIALHALNNTLAYGTTTDASGELAAAFGAVVIGGCVLLPRFWSGRPAPALR